MVDTRPVVPVNPPPGVGTTPGTNPFAPGISAPLPGVGAMSGVSLWGLVTGDQASRAYFFEIGKRAGIATLGIGLTVVGFVLVVSGSKQAQSAISTVTSVATKVKP